MRVVLATAMPIGIVAMLLGTKTVMKTTVTHAFSSEVRLKFCPRVAVVFSTRGSPSRLHQP